MICRRIINTSPDRSSRASFAWWFSGLPAVIALLGLIAVLGSAPVLEAGAADDAVALWDAYCGPRCVQRVLEYYGQDTELVALIREMQWPVSADGTNVKQLGTALESRGIQTRFVKIPKSAKFWWPHPAIFHLELNGAPHFVVWLPPASPGEPPRLFGATPDTIIMADQFLRTKTGAVLLTSDAAIPEHPAVGMSAQRAPSLLWLLLITPAAFVGGFFLARLPRRGGSPTRS